MGHSGRQLAVQLHVNASRPVGQNRGIPPCKLNLQTELSFSRSIRSSRLKHWRLRREYAACPQRRIFLGLLCSGYPIEERKKVCFSPLEETFAVAALALSVPAVFHLGLGETNAKGRGTRERLCQTISKITFSQQYSTGVQLAVSHLRLHHANICKHHG